MSHHLLIFLFLKAFERVTSLFQTWFFLLLVWCLVERLGSWIINSRVFLFVEESLISLKNFILIILRKERESIDLFYFFYRVDWVNSEYQSSHPSLTDSRSSLGINCIWYQTHRGWRRVVPDSADFLNPIPHNLLQVSSIF